MSYFYPNSRLMDVTMRQLFWLFLVFLIVSCKDSQQKNKSVDAALATQNLFKEEYRPQFHFTPPEKWMNDPNGLVYNQGLYHLFYQYYPDDIVWGPMHWGHAVSKDMLYWEHKPIALYPDDKGYIFSGSAVLDKKQYFRFRQWG